VEYILCVLLSFLSLSKPCKSASPRAQNTQGFELLTPPSQQYADIGKDSHTDDGIQNFFFIHDLSLSKVSPEGLG
jgi:hypothetical protein